VKLLDKWNVIHKSLLVKNNYKILYIDIETNNLKQKKSKENLFWDGRNTSVFTYKPFWSKKKKILWFQTIQILIANLHARF